MLDLAKFMGWSWVPSVNHERAYRYYTGLPGKVDCIIINAGGLTHYSVSLHDALRAVEVPVIEVHMTNIYAREEFRHRSLISPVASGGIFGFGSMSYYLALEAAVELLQNRQEKS